MKMLSERATPFARRYCYDPSTIKNPKRPCGSRPRKPQMRRIGQTELSRRQRQVFDFIKSELSKGYPFPTLNSIRHEIGISDSTHVGFSYQILLKLAAKGYLERPPARNARDENGNLIRWKVLSESDRQRGHGSKRPDSLKTRPP